MAVFDIISGVETASQQESQPLVSRSYSSYLGGELCRDQSIPLMPALAGHYQPYLGLDANDFRKPAPAWPASELILGR